MNRKILFISLVCVMAFTIAGCGKSLSQKAAENYIEGQTGADVNLKDDGFEITDSEGNTISAKAGKDLPSGWPSDVPYYKKGQIEQSSSMSLPQGKNYALVISSNDSAQEILDYYKDEFSGGWKVDMEINMGDSATITFSKDGVVVTVGVDSEAGEVSQSVMTNVE